MAEQGISAEVIDLRVINPLDLKLVFESVARTGRLLCVDGDWASCGIAGEVIAQCALQGLIGASAPRRMALPAAPAPTSRPLEKSYYMTIEDIVENVVSLLESPTQAARC